MSGRNRGSAGMFQYSPEDFIFVPVQPLMVGPNSPYRDRQLQSAAAVGTYRPSFAPYGAADHHPSRLPPPNFAASSPRIITSPCPARRRDPGAAHPLGDEDLTYFSIGSRQDMGQPDDYDSRSHGHSRTNHNHHHHRHHHLHHDHDRNHDHGHGNGHGRDGDGNGDADGGGDGDATAAADDHDDHPLRVSLRQLHTEIGLALGYYRSQLGRFEASMENVKELADETAQDTLWKKWIARRARGVFGKHKPFVETQMKNTMDDFDTATQWRTEFGRGRAHCLRVRLQDRHDALENLWQEAGQRWVACQHLIEELQLAAGISDPDGAPAQVLWQSERRAGRAGRERKTKRAARLKTRLEEADRAQETTGPAWSPQPSGGGGAGSEGGGGRGSGSGQGSGAGQDDGAGAASASGAQGPAEDGANQDGQHYEVGGGW